MARVVVRWDVGVVVAIDNTDNVVAILRDVNGSAGAHSKSTGAPKCSFRTNCIQQTRYAVGNVARDRCHGCAAIKGDGAELVSV